MAIAPKSRANPGLNRPSAARDVDLLARQAEAKIQLGARISEAKHRQLKLAAVLHGVTVQTLVGQAIQEFLTNHPELLHRSPVPRHIAKSPSRSSRPSR
jgi:DNA-nicking Smr family endonuclease